MSFDVVIVGAGMVGSALACALAAGSLRVALLEQRPPGPPDELPPLRVSALAPASQRLLAALGCWPPVSIHQLSPYREMRVWDGGGEIHFDSAELGQPQLGWIVGNQAIQYALWRRAAGFDSLSLYCPARLTAMERTEGQWRLGLDDGTSLSTALLVGADGARSRVRELAGIEVRGREYEQRAIVTTVTTEYPHQATAWQRFLATGPLAFLPLRDGSCSIVWSVGGARAEELLALDDHALGEQLTRAYQQRLGQVSVIGPRAAFPLFMQYAQRYVQPGLALIGDAAHVVHPLAGQGVNLGLIDAAALAEVVLDATHRGRPLDDPVTLRRYERWRRGENRIMLEALDTLERLFALPQSPVRWLRGAGLNLADRIAPLKHQLARQAMGLGSDLPMLMRSVQR